MSVRSWRSSHALRMASTVLAVASITLMTSPCGCTGAEPAVPLLSCGDLTLDPSSHRAIRGKVVIDLTVKEYRLLEYLIQNQGTAQSRLTLLKNVWDKNFDTNTNVVDVYVNYLRSKIDKDFDHKLIRTVVGVGYMMEA